MHPLASLVAVLALLALAPPAIAQIKVTDAWVRGIVPGQDATGAFMTLTSASDTTLVGAASPVASQAEIHSSNIEGGVMKMRAAPRVALAANKPLRLAPGGYHIMLMALTQPLSADAVVPITLHFEDAAGKRTQLLVNAKVRPLGGAHGKH